MKHLKVVSVLLGVTVAAGLSACATAADSVAESSAPAVAKEASGVEQSKTVSDKPGAFVGDTTRQQKTAAFLNQVLKPPAGYTNAFFDGPAGGPGTYSAFAEYMLDHPVALADISQVAQYVRTQITPPVGGRKSLDKVSDRSATLRWDFKASGRPASATFEVRPNKLDPQTLELQYTIQNGW